MIVETTVAVDIQDVFDELHKNSQKEFLLDNIDILDTDELQDIINQRKFNS